MNGLRHSTVVVLLACLLTGIAGAQAAPDALQILEDDIHFQLFPQPTLVFLAVNSSKQPVEGDFSFELVDVAEILPTTESSPFARNPIVSYELDASPILRDRNPIETCHHARSVRLLL
jgi:hypothetical protein